MSFVPFVDTRSNIRPDGIITTQFHDELVKRDVIDDTRPELKDPELGPKGVYFSPDGKDEKPTREELEEEEEEERMFLEKYREKRLQELKQEQSANCYGRVFAITEPDYKREVTEASKKVDVVLLLTCSGSREVAQLEEIFNVVASVHPQIKFVKIRGAEAIHNYPDENCPTVLVYRQGTIIKNWMTAKPFGGQHMSKKTFELELMKIGVISAGELLGVDDERDVDLKVENTKGGMSVSLTAKRGKGYRDEDEEDDDESDSEKKRGSQYLTGGRADTGDYFDGWKEVKFKLK
ncbi:putative phosducin family protein [Monocercomonoides exilis]|uniref:putative phosducin family protein n=1 Tax=Monocercomonoides exilis TaxID=2049356 RepID=UPI0035599BED|nr:putative phosducin family protein [Monocercomonoides exilis]|eukprot:MONOS_9064.1-p1 / transcript=MONOS_9064.1 / gene=MONOS_9064 / organism=Monocercomonoides_exilis_PA203 / gene_product=phosducin family protein / transcript_product=phosducin family protein / location=Mono_scaffold00361:34733-35794(+) / protein_length=291 / sequence_SO=supercontig / SO=protein_coding / is_pseudo=false